MEHLGQFSISTSALSGSVFGQRLQAARAQGRARFEQFVEQLGRHLLRGRSLVKDVVEEIQPDQSQFFTQPENANTVSSTDEPGAPS